MQSPYLKQLNRELERYTAQCGNHRPQSALELLWYCYSAANAIDDGQIERCEAALLPIYRELSPASEDVLFDHITELVTAYQRAAFLEGMQIGAQLTAQLLKK